MARSAFAVVLALAAASCIHVNVGGSDAEGAPVDRFHVLELGVAPKSDAASASAGVLAVRGAGVPGRFGKRVLRRDGPGLVVPLEHDFWADEPESGVTALLREALARTGKWAAVVDPADAHDADLVLEVQVLEFGIEAGEAGKPGRATFRARFTWSDGRSGKVGSTSVHGGSEPLGAEPAGGLGPAMAAALAAAVREAVR